MKFTTLIAAATLAVASTAATAQNVTTASGDVVMVEKNQIVTLSAAQWAALGLFGLTVAISAGSGS